MGENVEEKKELPNRKSKKIIFILVLIVIFILLFISGYFLGRNFNTDSDRLEKVSHQDNKKEKIDKEILVEDQNVVNDIKTKIDALSFSVNENYDYYIDGLYSDKKVSKLSSETKSIIAIRAKAQTIKYDSEIAKEISSVNSTVVTYPCTSPTGSCADIVLADVDNVSKMYESLFNEKFVVKEEFAERCTTHIFIKSINKYVDYTGCGYGGVMGDILELRNVYQVKKAGDYIYAYVNQGFLMSDFTKSDSQYIVTSGIIDGSPQTVLEGLSEEEANQYKEINDFNRDVFKMFKFTFKNNGSDDYYFVSAEMVK